MDTMDTKVFDLRNEWTDLDEAAEILRQGGIVAFPTETVYGLGGVALNPEAVAKIYQAKGRPADNPMIVHISGLEEVGLLAEKIDGRLEILAQAFWPGPLTIILPKKESVPDLTTGGLATVAIRMPDCEIALELIRKTGAPLAAPSANISGRPSPTQGQHVENDLLGKVDGIILGDNCKVGIESTVLDLSGKEPVILRPGTVTKEELSLVLGEEVLVASDQVGQTGDGLDRPKSPGTKYTHYSPKADMVVLQGNRPLVLGEIEKIKKERLSPHGVKVLDFGEKTSKEAARVFFSQLRSADQEDVDLIIAIAPENQDSVGLALMNRMLKAAGNNFKIIE